MKGKSFNEDPPRKTASLRDDILDQPRAFAKNKNVKCQGALGCRDDSANGRRATAAATSSVVKGRRLRRKDKGVKKKVVEKKTTPPKVFDIFDINVPRRPRSKRRTSVVKINNFTFRNLPALLNGETQPSTSRRIPSETSSITKTPRKPKSTTPPQRIVTPPKTVENGEGRRSQRLQQIRQSSLRRTTYFLRSESCETDDDVAFETEKQSLRSARRRRQSMRKRSPSATVDDDVRVTSLRLVIDQCLLQDDGNKASSTAETPIDDPIVAVSTPSPVQEPIVPQSAVQPEPKPEKALQERCHVVEHLLNKGALEIGDYVELLPVDAAVNVHGWITYRGILCANCAMVHSCQTFGACAKPEGSRNRIRVIDGRSFLQLLQ